MRDYATLRPSVCESEVLAECGFEAEVLFLHTMTRCCRFGRYFGSAAKLCTGPMVGYLLRGKVTADRVQELRDTLVERGLWLLYEVAGTEYIQFVNWDDPNNNDETWLRSRPPKTPYPDPPGRPEFAVLNRPHRTKRAQEGAAIPPDEDRPGGLPSPPNPPAAVPVGTAYDVDGLRQLALCHEQHSTRTLNPTDMQTLVDVLTRAKQAGVEWQALLTIMRQKQEEYLQNPQNGRPRIRYLSYYADAWTEHIDGALAERRPRPPQTGAKVKDLEEAV